jgi:murein DD-endopeptidase MepM/ murein hydrolase activator NlpD
MQPTATTNPTATPILMVNAVCSPLQGIAMDDLRLITSYDYSVKYPFSEGPENDKNHPAIDFGFYSSKGIPSYSGPELHTDDGFPIQALLPGKVVETVNNLYPYGNMILIETHLDALDPALLAKLNLPQPYPQSELDLHNPCAKDQLPISWSPSSRSIYTLYAHMKNPSSLKTGDLVQCGEVVGAIGATGNTSESIEHLHLEIRVGPSDARFGTISTYISTSTEEERYNYCIWALSEEFQSIDPSLFWNTGSGSDQ